MQYRIEKLFEVRKDGFKGFEGVPPELDLIEDADKITHNISLDEALVTEESCNVFAYDDDFDTNEALWQEIKSEILGEYKQAGFEPKQE